jgi:hypothetical protein
MSARRLGRLLCTAAAAWATLSVYVLHRNADASALLLGEHSSSVKGDWGGPYRDMPRNEEDTTPYARRRIHVAAAEVEPLLADRDLSEREVLQRSPSRRPGYVANSTSTATYFGYVMRDLAARLLSRDDTGAGDAESNDVLVVSKDIQGGAGGVPRHASTSTSTLDELRVNASVGPSFVRYATEEGHRVHSIGIGGASDGSPLSELAKWWEAQSSSASGPPRSIQLAVFDPPAGSEGVLAADIASRILSKVSIKYVVFRVSATTTVPLARGDATTVIAGAESVISLLEMDYKVQLLSSSHSLNLFLPNALIGRDSASEFLRIGAKKAEAAGGGTFTAYLFATRGLDLAIPSAREYFATLGAGKPKVDKASGDCYLFLRSCGSMARLEFALGGDKNQAAIESSKISSKEFLNSVNVHCGNVTIVDPKRLDRFWISGPSIESSEAVCAHVSDCGDDNGASACATRIIPAVTQGDRGWRNKPRGGTPAPPNLMLLDIDTISRPMFNQMLPKTTQLLDDFGFTSFDRYTPTALGGDAQDTKETQQTALFAGQRKSSQRGSYVRWIWDDLKDRGYAIFEGGDACLRKDDRQTTIMVSNLTHGTATHEMNCFDFKRPNCIAGKAAASRLIEHAAQFIDAYEQDEGRPWAAFLSFSDSREDTNVLSATLDDPLESLLATWRDVNPSDFDNAFIVILSHSGLTHGSYLQTRQGKEDRASPVLFVKPPLQFTNNEFDNALRMNADLWTTPFDVHATIRQVLFEEERGASSDRKLGSSLFTALPEKRRTCRGAKAIPQYLCDLLEPNQADGVASVDTAEMKSPPSMLSYYADIPSSQKQKRKPCSKGDALSAAELYGRSFDSPCNCSTSHRDWYECNHHPWKVNGRAVKAPHEYFAFVDCPNRTLSYETRVERNPAIVSRSQHRHRGKRDSPPPSILFIEVDSAAIAYADRHFPMTRELLSKHRIERKGQFELACKSGMCAVDLSSKFSVTGPNSISNQVRKLKGQTGI